MNNGSAGIEQQDDITSMQGGRPVLSNDRPVGSSSRTIQLGNQS